VDNFAVAGQGGAHAANPSIRPDFRVVQNETNTHDVQAAAEGVVLEDDGKLEFLGERFRLADGVALMPLLAFANASREGLDSDDMEGMAALYALIRDVVDQTREQKTGPEGEPLFEADGETPQWAGPSEWMRFERHAIHKRADGDDLMEFVGRAMAVMSARPRKRREISSGGSPQTSEKSRADSSWQDTDPRFQGLMPVADLTKL
jgi:hypothetical protein